MFSTSDVFDGCVQDLGEITFKNSLEKDHLTIFHII